jgi:hypothetical protein
MRALSEITKHNMSRCKSILIKNGYPVLDTQNLHIKLKPENPLQTGSNPASSQTVYRPTIMTLILVSNILYEYMYNEV